MICSEIFFCMGGTTFYLLNPLELNIQVAFDFSVL